MLTDKKNIFSRLFQTGKSPNFFHAFPDSVGTLQSGQNAKKNSKPSSYSRYKIVPRLVDFRSLSLNFFRLLGMLLSEACSVRIKSMHALSQRSQVSFQTFVLALQRLQYTEVSRVCKK